MFKFRSMMSVGGALLVAASILALPGAASPPGGGDGGEVQLSFSRIYWEYNSSAEDLGVHVTLDGEDWTRLKITNPKGKVLFQVVGRGPYKELGMTELFFEGAEPALADVPLEDLLEMFPEGDYDFEGVTVDGEEIEGEWEFTHAIPDGPNVSATMIGNDYLRIDWTEVTAPPAGFPDREVEITGYQVIVEPSFQVTLPPDVFSLTVSPEFVATLPAGENKYEVLAIEESANQTLREGTFVK